MLDKYDKDKDGKLSTDERRAMMEARQKEMLEKYDKDKDGKLSDEERAEARKDMPPMPWGGGRGGRGGRGGAGGGAGGQ
jgi:hypothetical protein